MANVVFLSLTRQIVIVVLAITFPSTHAHVYKRGILDSLENDLKQAGNSISEAGRQLSGEFEKAGAELENSIGSLNKELTETSNSLSKDMQSLGKGIENSIKHSNVTGIRQERIGGKDQTKKCVEKSKNCGKFVTCCNDACKNDVSQSVACNIEKGGLASSMTSCICGGMLSRAITIN